LKTKKALPDTRGAFKAAPSLPPRPSYEWAEDRKTYLFKLEKQN